MNKNKLSFCDYCQYYNKNGKECLARPNSSYCTEARAEFFKIRENKSNQLLKSLRKW